MIHVAIVEDEKMYADTLEGYIMRYSVESGEEFKVDIFSDGDGITKDYTPKYGIIFLDIEMKFMDGMTTARHIRNSDQEVILIFITNMAQYAIKGYQVDAMSYLLKPVPYFAFSQEMNRSIERLKQNKNNNSILLPNSNGMVKVDVKSILFIESYKHRIIVNTMNEKYSFVGTMKEMENRMKMYKFFRCNNGYLVNLFHVTGVKDNEAIVGDDYIPISRARKKDFLNSLTDYVGGLSK
ncbi:MULTISPECIES: LytTR family DNA-binding domain-containing protein [Paraliobacillus]|uniref:LytR/AlgR family response regulator transcription factor n=1 Tax=Paraliobacillus TaxID=200903 RepID=UPI000DD4172C|nr:MULTISPECIES: LytTR family DNA-binding domain-containing protein [Paraliobacillus]